MLADLVPDVEMGASETRVAARVKGDARMARVVDKAVHDRERPLREDLVVPFGVTSLRLRAEESERIVKAARRRFRLADNVARRFVEAEVFSVLAVSSRIETTGDDVRDRTRHLDVVREALERMWPVLTPADLLHDLFGSKALLRLAASKWLTEDEWMALHRSRGGNGQGVVWSEADVALLDEARAGLLPCPGGPATRPRANRIYGHIVVDEVQDLTPMQLRMIARRSLNGSMTVVGTSPKPPVRSPRTTGASCSPTCPTGGPVGRRVS